MDKPQLDPYLFFDGDCREAMNFYKGIFGGHLDLSTYGESPKEALDEMHAGEDVKDKIMHAKLEGNVQLMAADKAFPGELGSGKINLSLSGDDEEKLRGWFKQLGEGGKVKMPLEKQFWGASFGMLEDKFGVEWMVNINAK